MPKKKNKARFSRLFFKELAFSILAILSILLLAFEYITNPSTEVVKMITRFDFLVAVIFLTDFCIQLINANNKKIFLKQNWFLLLASIPLVDSWTEALRVLRIFGLVRLVRAGEHLHYATTQLKK